MKSRRLTMPFVLMAMLLFSVVSQAQTRKVSGRVTDPNGKPLEGVTITVKGTKQAVTSDGNGNFFINAANNNTLTFTFVGMEPTEQRVGSASNLVVQLNGTGSTLNDVVVIGYGTARKKDVTGAINTVTSKDFGNNSVTQPSQLLQGKAPGVQVVNNSGLPGSGANIVIRGVGSFSNVAPLYVIDGIQSDAGLFNAINPADIESLTVLKDAASTSIYGANGANGVVLVTTKKGRAGAPRINAVSQWGFARRPKKLDVMNAAQFYDLAVDYAASQGSTLPAKFNSPDIKITRTDWQDAIFRTGLVSNNSISVNGGSEKVLYNLSAGFIDQKAIVQNYHYQAVNFRFSLEEKLGIFRFGQNLNTQFLHNTGNAADPASALYMQPYFGIYDSTRQGGFTAATNVKDLSNAGNPLVNIYNRNTVNRNYVLNPQFFGEVNLLKSLVLRTQLALSFSGNNFSEFQKPFIDGNDLATGRSATEAQSTANWYLFENYATWNQAFNKHKIQLTGGTSYWDKGRTSFVRAQGTGIANDVVQDISVALTNTVTGASVGYARPVQISYFGRLVYNFDDKYVLTASFRRDGSSVFGPANKFGNFPGVGFAWNASNENFLRDIAAISSLKIRGTYGIVGNSSIGAFQTSPNTYSGSPTGNLVYSFGQNEAFYSGTTVNSIPNPTLKWEETRQTDVGFDLGLFKDAFLVTFDWYNRKNKDLLVNVPIPNTSGAGGVGGSPTLTSNAATAQNNGVEMAVTYRKTAASGFNYSVTVNGGYNKNKVLSLGSQFTAPIRDGAFDQNSAATYTAAGLVIGSFYGKKIDHVAIDQADIDKYDAIAKKKTGRPDAVYQANVKPGDYIFQDLDNNGVVDDNDVTILGNPIPKFVYGGTINLGYKNFDFNLAVSGAAGLKLYREQNYTYKGTAALHNVSTELLDRWRKTGDVAKYPRAGQNTSTNLQPSDFYIEDGSYMRVRMITLGYTVPRSALASLIKGTISSIRLYISAENMFTITGYKGYDPEISTPSGSSFIFARGIDRGQLPLPKTLLFGVQLGL